MRSNHRLEKSSTRSRVSSSQSDTLGCEIGSNLHTLIPQINIDPAILG